MSGISRFILSGAKPLLLIFVLLLAATEVALAQSVPPAPAPTQSNNEALFSDYVTLRDDLVGRNVFEDVDGTLADWRRAREMAVTLYGEDHPEVALADSELAIEHFMAGRIDLVNPALESVLSVLRTQPDAYAARIETVEQNLGVVALETGDGKRAIEIIQPLADRWLSSDDPEVFSNGIAALGNVAQAHLLNNQPSLGLEANERALRLARDADVLHLHPSLLNNNPLYYAMLGQDASAIQAARKGLLALGQMQGDEVNRSRAFLMSTLTTILQQAGRHGEAIDIGRDAVQLSAQMQGEDAPVTAKVMLSLQSALYAQGRYEEAIAVGEQINAIYDNANMGESVEALQSLEYRARAALRLDPSLEALEDARIALERSGSLDEPLAPHLFEAWTDFSRMEAQLKGEAAGLARLNQMEAALADSLQDNDRVVGLLAGRRALWTRGKARDAAIDKAHALALKADEVHQASLIASGLEARMTSRERIMLAETMQAEMEEGRVEDAFQLAQIFTHTGARVAHARARLMQQTDRADLQDLFAQRQAFLSEKAYLQRRIQRAASGDDANLVADLEKRTSELDASISDVAARLDESLPGWQETENPTRLTLTSLQDRLGPNERLLMPVVTGQNLVIFAAGPDRAIGDWQAISPRALSGLVDSIVQSVELSGLMRGRQPEPDSLLGDFDTISAHALYQFLFTPEVKDILDGGTVLHVVTNDSLSQIPFSLLVTDPTGQDGNPSYLIDKFAVATLPSLAALSSDPAQTAMRQNGFKHFFGMSAVAGDGSETLLRGSSSEASLPIEVDPLPNAREELEAIADAFAPEGRTLIFGDEASETRLRSLETGPDSLVVLATHGFAALETEDVRDPTLVFAGDEQNDGLVTASEVAGMRLPAGMVVLSACESGSPGYGLEDGLSGLASAFISAGAERVMVSHWPVRDDAAAFLTTRSISALSEGRPAAQALRDAIQEFRAQTGVEHADHPALWASFSYVGR